MSNVDLIVMQSSQADQVRGLTVLGHALAPVYSEGGLWLLPRECAFDAFHSAREALLLSFPHFALASSNLWPVPSSEGSSAGYTYPSSLQTIVATCTYKSSWPVGVTITVSTV